MIAETNRPRNAFDAHQGEQQRRHGECRGQGDAKTAARPSSLDKREDR